VKYNHGYLFWAISIEAKSQACGWTLRGYKRPELPSTTDDNDDDDDDGDGDDGDDGACRCSMSAGFSMCAFAENIYYWLKNIHSHQ